MTYANKIIEKELIGINTAAISGDSIPQTEKVIPTILYNNEIPKQK